MRFVVKSYVDIPQKLTCQKTLDLLEKIIRTRNKDLITASIYRDPYDTPDGNQSRIADHLAKSYKHKCAYCERICKVDIEHYRPKKGVNEDPSHSGYYWLCYEWSNLIPACITCNREGGKHNQFPIYGKRLTSPPYKEDGSINFDHFRADSTVLLKEKPFLLHPEIDDPSDYFKFEIDKNGEGIRIKGIDVNGRGDKTISICKLNRQELRIDRMQNVVGIFKSAVHGLFAKLENRTLSEFDFKNRLTECLEQLVIQSQDEEKTHTLLRKYIVYSPKNFEEIVLPFLAPKTHNIVRVSFQNMLSQVIQV